MITCIYPDGVKTHLRHVVCRALVVNDQYEVLLIKRSPQSSRGNKYAVPGGYLDRDETLQEGAIREFEEETGYKGEARYLFCINDNVNTETRKDDKQNVDFYFVVKIVGGTEKLNKEVTEIRWFSENNLPIEDEFAFDDRLIIKKFFTYMNNTFSLPIFARDIFV